MRRFAVVAMVIASLLIVGCKNDPQPKKEYFYIRIINESGKNVLWSLVEGSGQPSEYSEMKTDTGAVVVAGYGDTYTLYCYAHLKDTDRYEDGYSYQVRILSPRTEETVDVDCHRTYIRLGYDGNVITFTEEKYE